MTDSSGAPEESVSSLPGKECDCVYLGEPDSLRKRSSQYRPGPTQQTSLRIHCKQGGGMVTIAVATSAIVRARGGSHDAHLTRKTARVLAKHAALALTYLDGDAGVIKPGPGLPGARSVRCRLTHFAAR